MKLSEVTLRKTHLVFEDDAPSRGAFKLAPGLQQLGANSWMVSLPDGTSVINTTSQADAQKIQVEVGRLERNNRTPAQITNSIEARVKNRTLAGTFKRSFSITRPIRNATLADYENHVKARNFAANNPIIKLMNKPLVKLLSGWLAKAAAMAGPIFGLKIAILDINEEISRGGDGADLDELRATRNIMQGQLVAYWIVAIVGALSKVGSAKQLIRIIKVPLRGIQLATAVTGVGAPAAFVSLIVSEALWIVIPILLSSPAVQRYIAELLVDSMFGDIFEYMGQGLEAATGMADRVLAGRFGSGALAKAVSGFDPKETEAVTGEYYGESEWAKLVFGTLLFPPSQKSRLVPYIPKSRRETLLTGTLGLNPMDAADVTDTEGDNPEVVEPEADAVDANGETAADRGRRTREQSLQGDYSNPNFTRAQPMTGPR